MTLTAGASAGTPVVVLVITAVSMQDVQELRDEAVEASIVAQATNGSGFQSRADFIAIADGLQTIGEVTGERVIVFFDGCKMTLGIDPTNGRLVGLETRMRGPSMAIGDARMTYVEERTVDGVTLPCAWRTP